jgi:hypothetical protein
VPRKMPTRTGSKVLWRITDAAPLGEFVHREAASTKAARPKETPESHAGGVFESSFELLNGADVIDSSAGLPNDLLDKLFGAAGDPSDSGASPSR